MANLPRSAKLSNDWTTRDLSAYNIEIEFQDAATFFGVDPLPEPNVEGELLTVLSKDDMKNGSNYRFLWYMDVIKDQASKVVDFAGQLLAVLDYDGQRRTWMVRRRVDIPLRTRGKVHRTQVDVCIVDLDEFLLLIQVDKRPKELMDPEPQLIAAAIAAFQANNETHTQLLGQDSIQSKVVPGIILRGSLPIFYKVLVTSELAKAVESGEYPASRTIVHAYVPSLPSPTHRLSQAMKPLDNRRLILSCYEAFKQFIN